MAQRFGGKYSPDAKSVGGTPAGGRFRQGAVGLRARLLWSAPVLTVLTTLLVERPVLDMGLSFVIAILTSLAAWLTAEGLKAQAAYDERAVARRPAIPRKLMAAGLYVAAITIALGVHTVPIGGALFFGLVAAATYLVAFGPDPLRNKGAKGADAVQSDRVADAVHEAEGKLTAARERLTSLRDREATERFDAFAAEARALFRQVEADPADYAGARRHLGVYMQAALDATEKFVALQSRNPSEDARQTYLSLLDDLRGGYAQRTETLMLDDRTGMDVEIDVLRDRLRREGIKVEQ